MFIDFNVIRGLQNDIDPMGSKVGVIARRLGHDDCCAGQTHPLAAGGPIRRLGPVQADFVTAVWSSRGSARDDWLPSLFL